MLKVIEQVQIGFITGRYKKRQTTTVTPQDRRHGVKQRTAVRQKSDMTDWHPPGVSGIESECERVASLVDAVTVGPYDPHAALLGNVREFSLERSAFVAAFCKPRRPDH